MTAAEAPVLSVRGLTIGFQGYRQIVPVVRGLDFDVAGDELVCIVGESGSGKSVTALALCGLLPQGAVVGGSIRLNGIQVDGADAATLRRMRGEDVGFVFQDPATTLNPVLPVGQQIVEAPTVHGRLQPRAAGARAITLLREVEIADPAGRARQYPHEFSGGMRQRAVIAMAMAGRPRLIIADEPTTALDVTVQAQVLDLLARRRRELGAAVILITHDLGVVAEVADRVLVMYAGRIVEAGHKADIFTRPIHPYTQALLRSTPQLGRLPVGWIPFQGNPHRPLPRQAVAPSIRDVSWGKAGSAAARMSQLCRFSVADRLPRAISWRRLRRRPSRARPPPAREPVSARSVSRSPG